MKQNEIYSADLFQVIIFALFYVTMNGLLTNTIWKIFEEANE